MPTELYWAAGPPLLVAALVLLLTSWWSTRAASARVMLWLERMGTALAVATGYAIGHWGVAGLDWSGAEGSVVWGAAAAVGHTMLLPDSRTPAPGRRRIALELLRPAICLTVVAYTLRGTEIGVGNVGLGLLVYALWAVTASLPRERSTWLVATAWLISSLGLSITLLNSGSLKLALLAGALTSALGGIAMVSLLRGKVVGAAAGVVSVAFGVLLLNGYLFAELTWLPGQLLLASLGGSRLPGRGRVPAALVLAAAAAAVSWYSSPPLE